MPEKKKQNIKQKNQKNRTKTCAKVERVCILNEKTNTFHITPFN